VHLAAFVSRNTGKQHLAPRLLFVWFSNSTSRSIFERASLRRLFDFRTSNFYGRRVQNLDDVDGVQVYSQ
jgi:hypothetical protein